MKSTIKIGRDGNDQPVIILNAVQNYDDLRDDTIRKFIENLRLNSNFCTIKVDSNVDRAYNPQEQIWSDGYVRWHIKSCGTLQELTELRNEVDAAIKRVKEDANKIDAMAYDK